MRRDRQRFVRQIDQAEAVAGIRRGLESVERGEGEPASRLFQRLRRLLVTRARR